MDDGALADEATTDVAVPKCPRPAYLWPSHPLAGGLIGDKMLPRALVTHYDVDRRLLGLLVRKREWYN
jgi:hypothetical protein